MAKTIEQLEQEIMQLKQEMQTFKDSYREHQHNDVDGTYHLRKNIVLDQDQSVVVGCEQLITAQAPSASQGINFYGAIVTGEDMRNAYVLQTPNMEVINRHLPDDPTQFSFFFARRNPLVVNAAGTTISVTAAGNTVTISGYSFATNELAGAYINIYNSSNTLVETQQIASNTATVITIVGTWLNTTNNGYFFIMTPVFLGVNDNIWRRLYLEEGSATGGLRIGVGATANGQNGLLYMDAAGDLYWRDKANASTLLNLNLPTGLAGTKTYYVADSSGGAVTRKLTFTDGILTAET